MDIKFIAEVGSNWEGDLEIAKKHILNAKESGADFVKFQMWRADDLYSKDHPHWNFIQKSEITFEIAKKLKEYADNIEIGWVCSVFYPESVDFLENLNVPFYKIASRTSTLNDKFSSETIKKVGETKKTCFVSIGEGGDKEKLEKYFPHSNIKFTYCVSKYPTKDEEIDWKLLLTKNFFSDHTPGITMPIVYATLMQKQNVKEIFIEKHVKLLDNKGPDAGEFAITYDEVTQLISNLERIKNINLN